MNNKETESLLLYIQNFNNENRKKAVNIVSEHPKLIKNLIQNTFDNDNPLSSKYARVLELVCVKHSINYVLPYLDVFCENISEIKFESTRRACAKICEVLAISYTSNYENVVQKKLLEKHIDLIISTTFDWLITTQPIAVKAYTMQTLYLFGKTVKWIHPELDNIIRTKVIHQSKATTARGKHILKQIQKNNN